MRVLVTGSNGHVGANLMRELTARKIDAVPMVLPGSSLEAFAGLALTPVEGNVLDLASVENAARGCDVVINLAAVYETRAHTAEEIMQPAVTGVRNVLTVAAKLGVKRVIHTSSIVACGYGDAPEPLRTEADWNTRPSLPYYRAKTESERLAWKLADELKVPLVVLCPGAILGRYDYRTTPTMALVKMLASGDGATSAGGINYVDVRDVALAHALAIDKAEPGQRYVVGGENLSYRDFGELVRAETGVKFKHVELPRSVVLGVLRIQQLGSWLTGSEPRLTPGEGAEVVGRFGYFDTSKAERALGYSPRKGQEQARDALRWLAFRKALPPAVCERIGATLPPDPAWLR